jgi:soluble lytic murein transglycosylase-like protein
MVLALVQQESGGNQFTSSGSVLKGSSNDTGLFQLLPSTAAGLNVDPNTVSGNIQGGETYLQQLYNQFGNWNDALMAYNEGPGALQSQLNAGVTPTSTAYAATILQNAGMSDSSASDTSDSGVDDSGGDDSSGSLWGLSTGSLVAIALGVGLFAYAIA